MEVMDVDPDLGGTSSQSPDVPPSLAGSVLAEPGSVAPRYAGFWVRVVAFIVDGIVFAVVDGIINALAGPPMVVQQVAGFPQMHVGPTYWVELLIGIAYMVGFWSYVGRTPGMMIFGIRVVQADDLTAVRLGGAVLRYLGLVLSFLVIFIGVIWVGFDARKQGWHDKIARTVVIHERT